MRCIERHAALMATAALTVLTVLLVACRTGSPLAPPAPPEAAATTAPAPGLPTPTAAPTSTSTAPSSAAPTLAAAAGGAAPRPPRYVQLAAPATPRSASELRLQLARRLVAAHPDTSYTTRAPDRLLAIPVLEIGLNADGSVRRIAVLRRPSTGDESVALAIAAVKRAAPYGDVSRLPRPWTVVETFLFDDEMRFKPRTLDLP